MSAPSSPSIPPSAPVPAVACAKDSAGIAHVLATADPGLKVRLVHARTGKTERATPVAHLFEAGRVRLHGTFPDLEAQLLGMIGGGAYEGPGPSPDRADAMVWGIMELMLEKERGEPRILLL